VELLQWAGPRWPVVVLSDALVELVRGLLPRLGNPVVLCHQAEVDAEGFLVACRVRREGAKQAVVLALQSLGYRVVAVGDSYNDLTMLKAADRAVWCNVASTLASSHPGYPCVADTVALRECLPALLAAESP
jgi:phosphoserine / homoserine phosphotransferase